MNQINQAAGESRQAPEESLQKQNAESITSKVPEQLTNDNQQPSNEIMEVHKHPHHITHKKKWGEYLLEFFMLFLAVFLGFVAENIREHNIERQREKEYIESPIADLKSDQQVLEQHIVHVKSGLSMMDSMLVLLNTPS